MNDPPAQWAQSRTARTAIRFVTVGGGVILSVTALAGPSRADETQLTQAPPGPAPMHTGRPPARCLWCRSFSGDLRSEPDVHLSMHPALQ